MSSQSSDPFTPREMEQIRVTLWGNGKEGLIAWQRRADRAMFGDPATGEPGIAKEMREIRRLVGQIRALVWAGGAILAFLEVLKRFAPLLGVE